MQQETEILITIINKALNLKGIMRFFLFNYATEI